MQEAQVDNIGKKGDMYRFFQECCWRAVVKQQLLDIAFAANSPSQLKLKH